MSEGIAKKTVQEMMQGQIDASNRQIGSMRQQLEAAKQRELELLAVIEKMIEAANCVNHWHDWGKEDEGMVVSHDAVIHLWEVAASADVAIHGGDNSQALREHEAKVIEPYEDAWDDLLEDMELRGMHKFEPYVKSKANFRRMTEKRRKK